MLSYKKVQVQKKVPISFTCDVCGKLVEIPPLDLDLFDLQGIVCSVDYGTPSGGFSSDTIVHHSDVCSYDCLCSLICTIPFDAKISIPVSRSCFKI